MSKRQNKVQRHSMGNFRNANVKFLKAIDVAVRQVISKELKANNIHFHL